MKTPKIKKPKIIKPKNETFENARFLVEKYLKPELIPGFDCSLEIKVAKRLLKDYPAKDFWEVLELNFKLNSLAFFFTENGQAALVVEEMRQEAENNLTKQLDLPFLQDYPLEATSFGSETEHKHKPTNVIEFLDNEKC